LVTRLVPLLLLAACAAPRPETGPGEHIMVFGRLVPAGTRVVLWSDPGGLDAYKGGHFGRRPSGADGVTQVILHYDVAGTSRNCQRILDRRKLSCHFLLDLDGTVYQTLDVRERAWHAGEANDRSVGIEIANIGAYPDRTVLDRWYVVEGQGIRVALPPPLAGDLPEGYVGRPARPGPVRGRIHDTELWQYDFTDAQYEALGRLLAALSRALPIPAEAPEARTVLGDVKTPGFLAHFHLTKRKVDPGPAFDWERVMRTVEESR
jgi:N-acetyl-anhydromuramyl-L-alanine amidase AmpD